MEATTSIFYEKHFDINQEEGSDEINFYYS